MVSISTWLQVKSSKLCIDHVKLGEAENILNYSTDIWKDPERLELLYKIKHKKGKYKDLSPDLQKSTLPEQEKVEKRLSSTKHITSKIWRVQGLKVLTYLPEVLG